MQVEWWGYPHVVGTFKALSVVIKNIWTFYTHSGRTFMPTSVLMPVCTHLACQKGKRVQATWVGLEGASGCESNGHEPKGKSEQKPELASMH